MLERMTDLLQTGSLTLRKRGSLSCRDLRVLPVHLSQECALTAEVANSIWDCIHRRANGRAGEVNNPSTQSACYTISRS